MRAGFDYSNMGYAILGAITEEITELTWEENMEKELFIPLNMTHSNCNLESIQSSDNYAVGYSVHNDQPYRVEYENQYESAASGGINTTSRDLAKWLKMLMAKGIYNDQQIIPKAYLEASFSEHNIIRGSFNYDRRSNLLCDTYGYGWFVHQYKDLYRVNHGGNVSGFTGHVSMYPHNSIGIVILNNQGSSNMLSHVIEEVIVDRLLNRKRKAWDEYDINIGQAMVPVQGLGDPNIEKPITHDLAEYTGIYFHPGYGDIVVNQEAEHLKIRFPAFELGLEHAHYNTFVNRVTSSGLHQNIPSFYINFHPDSEGVISELTIDFGDEPPRFKKVKESDAGG